MRFPCMYKHTYQNATSVMDSSITLLEYSECNNAVMQKCDIDKLCEVGLCLISNHIYNIITVSPPVTTTQITIDTVALATTHSGYR